MKHIVLSNADSRISIDDSSQAMHYLTHCFCVASTRPASADSTLGRRVWYRCRPTSGEIGYFTSLKTVLPATWLRHREAVPAILSPEYRDDYNERRARQITTARWESRRRFPPFVPTRRAGSGTRRRSDRLRDTAGRRIRSPTAIGEIQSCVRRPRWVIGDSSLRFFLAFHYL